MIALAVQHFLLLYAGVFALVTLTASVGAGLAAADRVVMSPGGRIAAQAAHRALSFAAVAFLLVHLTVEVLAGRSRPASTVVPFVHPGRTFYLGLGTIASELLIVVVVTGLLRGRFASVRPAWLWRALHAVAYLCWPLAVMHGLMAGRTAKPYVDWSYGACVAAVALALVFRLAAGPRLGETAASHAEEAPAGIPSPAVPAADALAGTGLAGAGLAGPAGPGLPGPGSPFAPGTPPFVPGTGPPFAPGGTGAWGRRALPAPGGATGLTRGHPSYPGTGSMAGPAPGHPSYPGPGGAAGPTRGHPSWPGAGAAEPGYPDPAEPGHGYPGEGYPDPGYPEQGWAGHNEPARAPCPGDGGL